MPRVSPLQQGRKDRAPRGPSPTGDAWNRLCSHSCTLPGAQLLWGSPWPPPLGAAGPTAGGPGLPLLSSQAARSPGLRCGGPAKHPPCGWTPTSLRHAPRLLRPTPPQQATWDSVIRRSVRPAALADAPECAHGASGVHRVTCFPVRSPPA